MIGGRRQFLLGAGFAAAAPGFAQRMVDLGLPGGPGKRPLTTGFPGKGEMILQRTSPPLLETPMSVFDEGVITPNDRFFVRWHWGDIPTRIEASSFRLKVGGHITTPLELGLKQLLAMPRVEISAVNQCSGNSRGLFQPRIAGAQWRHGAMGNAKWMGVRLTDVLDKAGVRAGAVDVAFGGLDKALMRGAPDFEKSLPIDKARDGEVMIAFAMNGEQLPLANGFPLRLVVPGWFSTYWVKMLDRIEVLPTAFDGYWMERAYRIPTTPGATVAPGSHGFTTAPITRMVPRSWITSVADGATLPRRPKLSFGGIAIGGDSGVASVDVSADGGKSWVPARLGPDAGRYSFRRFDAELPMPPRGPATLFSRCTSLAGERQPLASNWNPGGFLRNVVETTLVTLA